MYDPLNPELSPAPKSGAFLAQEYSVCQALSYLSEVLPVQISSRRSIDK